MRPGASRASIASSLRRRTQCAIQKMGRASDYARHCTKSALKNIPSCIAKHTLFRNHSRYQLSEPAFLPLRRSPLSKRGTLSRIRPVSMIRPRTQAPPTAALCGGKKSSPAESSARRPLASRRQCRKWPAWAASPSWRAERPLRTRGHPLVHWAQRRRGGGAAARVRWFAGGRGVRSPRLQRAARTNERDADAGLLHGHMVRTPSRP